MQICQEHWTMLRKAIADNGLSHLVAKSGEQAFDNTMAEFNKTSDPKDYDPLMACNWMIMSEGLRQGGLYIMTQKEDGTQYCPVCEAIIHNPPEDRAEIEKFWINGPANAALEVCRELGLVPGVQ